MINKTLSALGLALLCILGLGMFGCGQESNDDHSILQTPIPILMQMLQRAVKPQRELHHQNTLIR